MIPIDIRPESRILIVAPHPDDECIGAGGVLVKYAAQCDVVLLTNGCACNPERPKEENAAIRHEEFTHEMVFAGVHRYWEIGIEDGTLAEHADCLLDFDLAPYDIIFTANHLDNHADHRAAFECLRRALAKQACHPTVYEYEIATPFAAVSEYLDLTDTMEQKLALIRFHQSQLESLDYVKLARSLASYRAVKAAGETYVEAYARASIEENQNNAELQRITSQFQRTKQVSEVMYRWLCLLASGRTIEKILLEKDYHIVALYGYTPLARILMKTLKNSGVKIAYLIDRKAASLHVPDTTVLHPEDYLTNVDVVVITVLHDVQEISKLLMQKGLRSESADQLLQEADCNT